MQRTATAHWAGDLKSGGGDLSTQSRTLNETPYSFSARFEAGKGTNPEELLAAAHAGCFTMALSSQLAQAGIVAESLDTKCTITLDVKTLSISSSELELHCRIPGADPAAVEKAVLAAKEGCPVSKLYRTEIKLSWDMA